MRISDDDLGGIDPLALRGANPFMAIMPTQRYSTTQLIHTANTQCAKHRPAGRPQGEDRFHITLHQLAYDGRRTPLDFFRDVSAAAEETAAPVPPFEIQFDRLRKFGDNAYALCSRARNDALQQFWERLGTLLNNRGLLYGGADFDPHITIFYDAPSPLDEEVEPVSWIVNQFRLVIRLRGITTYLIPEPWMLRG